MKTAVIVNMAMSCDGKVATSDRTKLRFGSAEDRALLEDLRGQADIVLIGHGTLRDEDPPLLIRNERLADRYRQLHNGNAQPYNGVVCTTIDPRLPEMAFFRHPATRKIMFTSESNQNMIRVAEQFAHVVRCRMHDGRVDVRHVVEQCRHLGLGTVLIEGGGSLNFSAIQADIVDEIYLTVCPFVFGGATAPTVVDGDGFAMQMIRSLRLESCHSGKFGEVFLHYTVTKETPTVGRSDTFAKGFDLTCKTTHCV